MNPNDFNTRIELRDYVVDLIQKVGITDSLKENYPDEYEFFKLLFQRHPEKDRKEVDLIVDIYVKPYIKANIKFLEITSHQFIIIKNQLFKKKLYQKSHKILSKKYHKILSKIF